MKSRLPNCKSAISRVPRERVVPIATVSLSLHICMQTCKNRRIIELARFVWIRVALNG